MSKQWIEIVESNSVLQIQGKRIFKYGLILLLSGLFVVAIWVLWSREFFLIFPVTIAYLFGLSLMQFPRITLTDKALIIESKALVPALSHEEHIPLHDIRKVSFGPGYFRPHQMILQTLSSWGAYGGFHKPQGITLQLRQGKSKTIQQLGSGEEFNKLYKALERKLRQSATN